MIWEDNGTKGSMAVFDPIEEYETPDSEFTRQRMEQRQAKKKKKQKRSIYFGIRSE